MICCTICSSMAVVILLALAYKKLIPPFFYTHKTSFKFPTSVYPKHNHQDDSVWMQRGSHHFCVQNCSKFFLTQNRNPSHYIVVHGPAHSGLAASLSPPILFLINSAPANTDFFFFPKTQIANVGVCSLLYLVCIFLSSFRPSHE